MSNGILPSPTAGGIVVRDGAGNPTNPPNVQNAYSPPATFGSTCQLTALPSDCTARFDPGQINALVSEILCLAAALNPNGTWNCASVCNLASQFTAWLSGTGPGTLSAYVDAYETVTALSFNPGTQTLTYTDENGNATPLDLSGLAVDVYVNGGTFNPTTMELTLTDTSGATPNVVIPLGALLGVSGDAANILINGADGKPYLSCGMLAALCGFLTTINPQSLVSDICADPVAKNALATCLVSPAPNNTVVNNGTGLFSRQEIVVSPTVPAGTDAAPILWRNSAAGVVSCVPPGGVALVDSGGVRYLGNRPGLFEALQTIPQTMTPFVFEPMELDTVVSQAWFGSWNPATYEFTFACPGIYQISTSLSFTFSGVQVNEGWQAISEANLSGQGLWYENDSDVNHTVTPATVFVNQSGSKAVPVGAGQVFQFRGYAGGNISATAVTEVGRRVGISIVRIGDL